MQYIEYQEYLELGGVCDETAFSRYIDKASAMIDIRTHNRLKKFEEIPRLIKVVCVELIDYLSTNRVDKSVTGRSQSAGGVSESESYAVKKAEDFSADLDSIFEPLATISTENGVSLLYKGAMD